MKLNLYAFSMCQSMFCALPLPGKLWKEEARDRMLLFLPLVGLEIGGIWALAGWLCRRLAVPASIQALVLTLCPYLLTGGIHLDGFMDVTDALGSWRPLERRREILKDSHVGSFAVIGLAMVLLAGFAGFLGGGDRSLGILILVPAVSRCGSALAVTTLPPLKTSQYAARQRSKTHVWILSGMLLCFLAGGALVWGRDALVLIGCLGGYALALGRGYRGLEGMNGDLSGYALTLGELTAALVWALL